MAKPGTMQSALDAAKIEQLPKVEPYYDAVYQRTYGWRWDGFTSGFVAGGISGVLIGAAAAFIPAIVQTGPMPSPAIVGQSAALFGSLSALLGTAVGTHVGASVGAVAAGFEEHERREKLEKIREQHPEMAAALEQAATARAEAEQPRNRLEQFASFAKRMVIWPLFAIGMGVGAAVGAIFALNPLTGFGMQEASYLFPAAGATGNILTSAGIGALLGGPFLGVDYGLISHTLANGMRPLVSGEIFQKDSEPVADISSLPAMLPLQHDVPSPGHYASELTCACESKAFRERIMDSRLAEMHNAR